MNEQDHSQQISPAYINRDSDSLSKWNLWEFGFFIVTALLLTLGITLYLNFKNRIAPSGIAPNTIQVSTIPDPVISEKNNSDSPLLLGKRMLQDKEVGIFAIDKLYSGDDYLLTRSYVISLVKNEKPFINEVPGFITTSLAESIYSCNECFDIIKDKIYVINGETNTINSYSAEFYDERSYFIHEKAYPLSIDPMKVGHLFSITCEESSCLVMSGYKQLYQHCYSFNPLSGTFVKTTCK